MAGGLNELRRVTRRLHRDRERQHQLIREVSENGTTRRDVARATGLSLGAIQKIVKGLGAIALVALTLSTAPADAHVPRKMIKWQEIGRAYFPDTCSPVEIDASHPDLGSADAMAPLFGEERCAITLGRSFHRLDHERQCAIIVHEYGHLAGLLHSSDSDSIMHPNPADVPECASRTTKYRLKMHAGPRR